MNRTYTAAVMAAISILTITAVGSATHNPADETISVNGTVTDDSYRYYLDEDKVAYPAMYTREQVDGEWTEQAIYENTSVERFAAMKGNDIAADELEQYLKDALDVNELHGVSIGSTGHDTHHYAINVGYMEPDEDDADTVEPSFSYETLQDAVPDGVTATVTFAEHTETVSFPVTTETVHIAEELDDARGYLDANGTSATQSGGSSDGGTWRANITKQDSACWSSNTSEQVQDVSYGREDATEGEHTISFSGVIETGTPCHDVSITDIAQSGDTYTVNITTERSDEICVDCVGQVSYDAAFTADRAFRLEVLHNDEPIDTLDYPGYTPADPATENGILDQLINWFMGIF